MADTYTGPHAPAGGDEYYRLVRDGETIDEALVSHELMMNPDLFTDAVDEITELPHELQSRTEDRDYFEDDRNHYKDYLERDDLTDDDRKDASDKLHAAERNVDAADQDLDNIAHRQESLSYILDPNLSGPLEEKRDLNTPEARREAQRAAETLKQDLEGIIEDIRVDHYNRGAGRLESREHMDRKQRIDEILREFPYLSKNIETQFGHYVTSSEAHHDTIDSRTGKVTATGHLSKSEAARQSAEDAYLTDDPWARDVSTVEYAKAFKDHHKANAAHERARTYATVDGKISDEIMAILDGDLEYYNYDQGVGKDPAEFYNDEIERENVQQEHLRSSMVDALQEWRETASAESEARVYGAMVAMQEHMSDLNEQANNYPERHTYYNIIRGQRETMMRTMLTTRYMREQVRISYAFARSPEGTSDFRGRREVTYNEDKSIRIGGVDLYPDGIVRVPDEGRDDEGKAVDLYVHPDGSSTITKRQPFMMDVAEPRIAVRPDNTPVPGEKKDAAKARHERSLAFDEGVASGRIIEDDHTSGEDLIDEYNEISRKWFENQSDPDVVESYRETAYLLRHRLTQAMDEIQEHIASGSLSPDREIFELSQLAALQENANRVTYEINFLEAGHNTKPYKMGPNGAILTTDTINGDRREWLIYTDGSSRRITRGARGAIVPSDIIPSTGAYAPYATH
jgi:hypothetical protein